MDDEEAREAASRVGASEDFLAALAHALRLPLHAMIGWLQVLRQGGADAGLRGRAVEALERSARQQARLADDLLEVARIVAGTMPLEAAPLDLAAVVRGAVLDVLPAADTKGIALVLSAADQPMPATGDGGRLARALASVLDNAIRFTPHGGRVDVAVTSEDAHAAIVVRDTGEGMSAEALRHLFERPRATDPTAPPRGGLGVGLLIARYVVEAHGGRIAAASAGRGFGCSFTLTLPLAAA